MIKKEDNTQRGNFAMLYTCLSLLLLCFFIFLIANSMIDPQKKRVVIGSLIGSFGMLDSGISFTGDVETNNIGFTMIPLSKNQNLIGDLIEITKLYKRDKIKVATKGDKIIVKFAKNTIFQNNSVNINRNILPVMQRIMNRIQLLKVKNFKLNIITYFNNSYIATYRAFNIAEFFIKNFKISSDKVSSFSRVLNKNSELELEFAGNYKLNNVEQIKYGDFIFKVK